jgi:hypothetical protein
VTLTDAQKQAYARAHTSTMHLWCVEMRHASFPSPLRVVQHKANVTVTLEATAPVDAGDDVLFTALGFRLREPEISTEPDTTITIEVDGVTGSVIPYLATANQTTTPIEVTCRAIAYDVVAGTVTALLGIFHLQVRHIRSTLTTVSLSLGYTNSANQDFPNEVYTPESNPGLV